MDRQSREEPPNARPRKEPGGSLVTRIAFWGFLGVIPFSLLVFVVVHAMNGGPLARDIWTLGFIVITLSAIVWACAHIIMTHISRDTWERRVGKACTRCGYELGGPTPLNCPECGTKNATRAPWEPPGLPIPAAVLFLVFLVCALGSFIWPVVTGAAGTLQTLFVIAVVGSVSYELIRTKWRKRRSRKS